MDKTKAESKQKEKYDWKTHGDFSIWFDKALKRNYWTLGYFGGGAINISDAYDLAKDYAAMYNVPLESIVIDEIQRSRRFKSMKVIFSSHETIQTADPKASHCESVWGWLTD